MKHVITAWQIVDGYAYHVTEAKCESLTGVFHKVAVRLGAHHVRGEYDPSLPVHFTYDKEES